MPIEQPVEMRSAVVASPGFMASIASVFIQDMARAAGSADFASLPCARSSAFVSAASDSCWRLLLASRRCSGPSGLLMLLLALTPLAELDYDSLAEAISRLELEKEEARTGIEIQNQELVASIISGRVQTYILDKASSLGMQISVELEMETQAATPYPSGVTIRGAATPTQKQQLQTYLEQTFAIAPERQVWLP